MILQSLGSFSLKPSRFFARGLLLALGVILLDQASKIWVLFGLEMQAGDSVSLLPFFSLTMVWNKGISMGVAMDQIIGAWGLIGLTFAISLYLLFWLLRAQRALEVFALGLIVGGALGNIIDRLWHGAVVDFLHFYAAGYSFYIFNVADAAISVGVGFLLFDGLRFGSSARKIID